MIFSCRLCHAIFGTSDNDLITGLCMERYGLHVERVGLRLKDHEGIARIRSEYGAIIRAFMGRNK